MCEPACIKYTAGSNFTCSNLEEARAVAKRTYESAVELFAMLCKKYGLDPLADGVVISHREGHSRGIASNHGDPEHLWTQLGMGYTMDSFRKAVKAAMGGASSGTDGYTKIMGNAVAAAEQMKAYLKAKNPNVVQSVLDMVRCIFRKEKRRECVATSPLRSPALRRGISLFPAPQSRFPRTISAAWA
jgi:hypothetical protein